MGVRIAGDPAALAPRLRAIAAEVDPGVRLDEVRPLDELAWRDDLPQMVARRRDRRRRLPGPVPLGGRDLLADVGQRRPADARDRPARGARRQPGAPAPGIFSRAVVLVGSGIVAGNLVLLLFVILVDDVDLAGRRRRGC